MKQLHSPRDLDVRGTTNLCHIEPGTKCGYWTNLQDTQDVFVGKLFGWIVETIWWRLELTDKTQLLEVEDEQSRSIGTTKILQSSCVGTPCFRIPKQAFRRKSWPFCPWSFPWGHPARSSKAFSVWRCHHSQYAMQCPHQSHQHSQECAWAHW